MYRSIFAGNFGTRSLRANILAGFYARQRRFGQVDSIYNTLLAKVTDAAEKVGVYVDYGWLLAGHSVELPVAAFTKAIEVDSDQPEAHYNLGFLGFEDGDLDGAADCFRRAVELDSTFADAHFNLAMTLFRLDQDDTARVHWKRYLALEPTGPWADIARRRLQEVN